MTKTLTIEPVDGCSLPREDAPTRRIVGVTEVPDRAYYRRAIRRADVRLVEAKKTRASAKKEG
jgi:hypothetical protein